MNYKFYRSLYRIRRVEEEISRVYPLDKIKSPVHLSIGQEAVSVGVCGALRSDDIVFGTYRSNAFDRSSTWRNGCFSCCWYNYSQCRGIRLCPKLSGEKFNCC